LPPRDKRVKEALLALHNPSLHPIFVHCLVGADRTTLITALYRMYYQDWTPEAAWREMLKAGFHSNWWLLGFKTYFWKHTEKPDWVVADAPRNTRSAEDGAPSSGVAKNVAGKPRQGGIETEQSK
jgi:hypothetical protein